MKTIFDVVTPANTKAYYENVERTTYLGETLFPATKQLGLDISFLKGSGGLPVQLQPAAFDAVAPLRDRIGVEGFNTEMPFFRERMLVSEKERQQINTYLANNNTEQANVLVNRVYQDAKQLIDGADVTVERMRMQLLATGGINMVATAEGRAVNYNYQLDDSQFDTLVGSDAWTDAGADPIADIEAAQSKVGAKRAIMNDFTFNLLRKHASVVGAVGDATGKRFVTKQDVLNFFRDEYDLAIAVYDYEFKETQGGPAQKFFPDYKITFIPNGTLGETVYGTTPEESDLMTGASDAEVSIVNTGVAVTTRKHTHPVNVETIVSEIALPSFPLADKIHILTVGA